MNFGKFPGGGHVFDIVGVVIMSVYYGGREFGIIHSSFSAKHKSRDAR